MAASRAQTAKTIKEMMISRLLLACFYFSALLRYLLYNLETGHLMILLSYEKLDTPPVHGLASTPSLEPRYVFARNLLPRCLVS